MNFLPAGIQKRLALFLVRRAIGQFLDSELDLDNLDLQLGNGKVKLRDLGLNLQLLNELCLSHNLPFEIARGSIGEITATVPWTNLWSGNCSLEIADLKVDIQPRPPLAYDYSVGTDSIGNEESHILSSSIHFAGDFLRSELSDDELAASETSDAADAPSSTGFRINGLHVIAKLIDRVLSTVQFTSTNTLVRLIRAETSHSLDFNVPYITYLDETSNGEEGEAGSATADGGDATHGVSGILPTSLQRSIKFNGVSIALTRYYWAEPVGGVAVADQDIFAHTFRMPNSPSVARQARALFSTSLKDGENQINVKAVYDVAGYEAAKDAMYMTATESLLAESAAFSSNVTPTWEVEVLLRSCIGVVSSGDIGALRELFEAFATVPLDDTGKNEEYDSEEDDDSQPEKGSSDAFKVKVSIASAAVFLFDGGIPDLAALCSYFFKDLGARTDEPALSQSHYRFDVRDVSATLIGSEGGTTLTLSILDIGLSEFDYATGTLQRLIQIGVPTPGSIAGTFEAAVDDWEGTTRLFDGSSDRVVVTAKRRMSQGNQSMSCSVVVPPMTVFASLEAAERLGRRLRAFTQSFGDIDRKDYGQETPTPTPKLDVKILRIRIWLVVASAQSSFKSNFPEKIVIDINNLRIATTDRFAAFADNPRDGLVVSIEKLGASLASPSKTPHRYNVKPFLVFATTTQHACIRSRIIFRPDGESKLLIREPLSPSYDQDEDSTGYGFQSWYDIGGGGKKKENDAEGEPAGRFMEDVAFGECAVAIDVSVVSCELHFEKADYDTVLLLTNSLSLFGSRNGPEDLKSLATSGTLERSELRRNARSGVLMELKCGSANFNLHTSTAGGYAVQLRDVDALTCSGTPNLPDFALRAKCGDVRLLNLADGVARPALNLSVVLTSDKEIDLKETSVVVGLSGLVIKTVLGEAMINDLSKFFKEPAEIVLPEVTDRVTRLNASFDDVRLDYSASAVDSRVMFVVEKLKLTTNVIPGSPTFGAKVVLTKGFVYLLEGAYFDRGIEELLDKFALVATLDFVDASVRTNEGELSPKFEPRQPFYPSSENDLLSWDDSTDKDDCILIGSETSQKGGSAFTGDVVYVYDSVDSFMISEDHFALAGRTNDEAATEEESTNIVRLRIKDVDVTWRIFDGSDWNALKPGRKVNVTQPRSSDRPSDNEEFDFEDVSNSSSSVKSGDGPSSTGAERSQRAEENGSSRSKSSRIEFRTFKITVELDTYPEDSVCASRLLLVVRDFEIIDNVRTSLWRKFLAHMRPDSDDRPRETESDMIRLELVNVRPNPSKSPAEESRLKVSIMVCNGYILQKLVLDRPEIPHQGQLVEFYPILMKIDYKPKHIDYTNLKDGNLIEILNFFHLDGAEMTLRDIRMTGVKGWSRLVDNLIREWLPHIRNTQVPRVMSGVSSVKTFVNLGAGIADLILLPIEQYRKDGRIIKGLQKGVKSFAKAATMETLRLGTRLAVGTQVLLEHADEILSFDTKGGDGDDVDQLSKFAEQPRDIREGLELGLHSMKKNIGSAAKTILAVPMEVYERTGAQGTARAVIRAVPVAVLKPMIGATEAVSKTLIGLQNSIEPSKRLQQEDKYKG
ncbi:autophagy- protein 2 [Irineochytrium annulatum]|nr:autophagy- protein 2 [Irineochytrium annulatum]